MKNIIKKVLEFIWFISIFVQVGCIYWSFKQTSGIEYIILLFVNCELICWAIHNMIKSVSGGLISMIFHFLCKNKVKRG